MKFAVFFAFIIILPVFFDIDKTNFILAFPVYISAFVFAYIWYIKRTKVDYGLEDIEVRSKGLVRIYVHKDGVLAGGLLFVLSSFMLVLEITHEPVYAKLGKITISGSQVCLFIVLLYIATYFDETIEAYSAIKKKNKPTA